MNPIRRAMWWAADYLYAGRHQLAILSPPWSIGRPRPTPPAWRRGDAGRPDVVLLPGVYEHWTFLRPLGDALAAAGHRVRVVHGLGMNRRSVAETAARLRQALAAEPPAPDGVVLVAHSKGGLVGKHLLIDADAASGGTADLRVHGLVAVCTPFAGSRLARLLVLDPSIRAFLPDDETIRTLGAGTAVNARIVSVFGPFDPHIPEGSELLGGINIRVPAPGHFRVLGSPRTHEAVVQGIKRLTP